MLRYIIRRLIAFVGILFAVSFLAFFLVHLAPGDPLIKILDTSATPENIKLARHALGLDHGYFYQYFAWCWQALHLDFGYAWTGWQGGATSNASLIGQALPPTFELILISQIFALVISIPLALSVARFPNGFFDRAATTFTFILLALPTFVLMVLGLEYLTVKWPILPGPSSYVSFSSDPWQSVQSVLLGAIVIGIPTIASYYRFLRSDLIANLQEDYILMARSKGLTNRRILWRHAVRPSSTTLISSVGLTVGNLLAGVFVVEFTMAMPGIGALLLGAVNSSDYHQAWSVSVVIAFFVIVVLFISDFALTVIDPRIPRD